MRLTPKQDILSRKHGENVETGFLLDVGNALRRGKPTVKEHILGFVSGFHGAAEHIQHDLRRFLASLPANLPGEGTTVAALGRASQKLILTGRKRAEIHRNTGILVRPEQGQDTKAALIFHADVVEGLRHQLRFLAALGEGRVVEDEVFKPLVGGSRADELADDFGRQQPHELVPVDSGIAAKTVDRVLGEALLKAADPHGHIHAGLREHAAEQEAEELHHRKALRLARPTYTQQLPHLKPPHKIPDCVVCLLRLSQLLC